MTDAPTSALRLSRLRAGLLAFGMFVLSLTVVVATPSSAAAWATTPTPVQIGGALKSPPARIVMWTPAGRVIGLGVMLGLALYETKDSWLPTIERWLANEGEKFEAGGHTVYANGRASAYYDRCTSNTVTVGKQVPTDGGKQHIAVRNEFSCELTDYPQYKPSYSLSTISTCRRDTTGAMEFYKATKSVPGGQLGTQQQGFKGTASFNDLVTFAAHELCGGLFNRTPVEVVVGLPSPSESMLSLGLHKIDGLNSTATGLTPESKTQVATINCRRPDGTTFTLNESMQANDGRLYVPSCQANSPGSVPISGSFSEGYGAAQSSLGTFGTNSTLYTDWGNCFGPTGLLCKTEVYVDGQRCIFGRDVCIIWPKIARAEPERVQCRFGTHVLPLSDCSPLRRAYGDVVKITSPTLVGELNTPFDEDLAPTPNPSPTPSPSASPTPTSPPTTTTAPNPTTGPNPEVVTEPPPNADPNSRSCYGDAWGWNPVDWVYVPVKCSLKWAFVPKTPFSARATRIKTAFDGKFPFTVPAMIDQMGSGTGGGCPSWQVVLGADTWSAVCDSSFTQAIVGARGWLTGGMLAAAFWPLVRGLFFASVPIIKPAPTDAR